MSINLSDLTSPNNQEVLAEITSGADFLDPIGKLENLSRSPNSGSDALQTTALNQPRALPLIKNPQGDLGGYLYIPNVSNNYATGPSVTIGANQTWQAEVDMVVTQFGSYIAPMGGGYWASGFGVIFYSDGGVRPFSKGSPASATASGVTLGTPFNLKYGFDGTNLYVDRDNTRVYTATASSQSGSITHSLQLNQTTNLSQQGNYAIQKAKLTINSSVVFDCDFNGSTSIRHGDTKFQAAVGGPVTINQSGNDPSTIIKKPVLRFANTGSTSIGFDGLFSQELNGGYMFAALSVLGDGGGSYAHVFATNKTGGNSDSNGGVIFSYRPLSASNLGVYRGTLLTHDNLFDSDNGDFIFEHKATNTSSISRVNDADTKTSSITYTIESDEFKIGKAPVSTNNAAIDLEFLALFPASITDEQADSVRNYINNRNNVFSLVDNSYYFFDPQKATFTGNFTGANTLDGYITGSDLGDTDVRTNLTLEQATLNDQPSTDGYTITFNDAAEHLEFENGASQNLSGWQVCGTSLGTFVYRVQGAVTELNLLGNAGGHRSVGDSYGIILLPESATGADIESARRLLIDRGAADGATASSYQVAWYLRSEIKEFQSVNMNGVTNVESAWNSSGLISFNTPLPSATIAKYAFYNCTQLSDFRTTDIKNGTDFTGCWQNCSALTTFPAGAKLGTEATTGVNFSSAWRESGLTSFPALDLSNGTVFSNAWRETDLISFPAINLQNGIEFVNTWYDCKSLSSFGNADLNGGKNFASAWRFCTALEDFPPLFTNWNPASIQNTVFNVAWDGCTSLTAQSVENILVSIDASGKYATTTGASGGTALGDAGIDIDYNGDPLSAATNSAVDSLKAKGWSIIVNNVTL